MSLPVKYRNIASTAIDFARLEGTRRVVSFANRMSIRGLAGIVIGHGTATLEETAYFLNLTVQNVDPRGSRGAQRPSSALSSDAGMNLVNALRVAASPERARMGVARAAQRRDPRGGA